MTRNLPDAVRRLVADYDIKTEEMWLVPGGKVYAIKHTAIERMAAQAGIQFDPPQVLEGSGTDKVVALMGTARLGTRTEWSIGEAAPSNNKNAYPWAIAEKRLKGRLTLKLLSAYGTVYSEDESEDFKASTPDLSVAPLDEYEAPGEPDPFPGDPGPRKSAHSLRKDQPERWSEIVTALRSCVNVEDMRDYAEAVKDETSKWPEGWLKELRSVYRDHADSLTARAA